MTASPPPNAPITAPHGQTIHYHRHDLPPDVDLGPMIAVDTEAMGLNPHRDRLCVVQLSAGDGTCHLVHFPEADFRAPNLRDQLGDPQREKLFHFARFDVAMVRHYLGVMAAPLFCTKIASRLIRTYTDKHGLRELCRELLGVELSKEQQSSDWGASELTPAQQAYAANDVLYLHRLRTVLTQRLEREGRQDLARACFDFLPTRAALDLAGWPDIDIFAHS